MALHSVFPGASCHSHLPGACYTERPPRTHWEPFKESAKCVSVCACVNIWEWVGVCGSVCVGVRDIISTPPPDWQVLRQPAATPQQFTLGARGALADISGPHLPLIGWQGTSPWWSQWEHFPGTLTLPSKLSGLGYIIISSSPDPWNWQVDFTLDTDIRNWGWCWWMEKWLDIVGKEGFQGKGRQYCMSPFKEMPLCFRHFHLL